MANPSTYLHQWNIKLNTNNCFDWLCKWRGREKRLSKGGGGGIFSISLVVSRCKYMFLVVVFVVLMRFYYMFPLFLLFWRRKSVSFFNIFCCLERCQCNFFFYFNSFTEVLPFFYVFFKLYLFSVIIIVIHLSIYLLFIHLFI